MLDVHSMCQKILCHATDNAGNKLSFQSLEFELSISFHQRQRQTVVGYIDWFQQITALFKAHYDNFNYSDWRTLSGMTNGKICFLRKGSFINFIRSLNYTQLITSFLNVFIVRSMLIMQISSANKCSFIESAISMLCRSSGREIEFVGEKFIYESETSESASGCGL